MFLILIFALGISGLRVGQSVWRHKTATFGPAAGTYNVLGEAYDLNSGANANLYKEGCDENSFTGIDIKNKIVIIQRGHCYFAAKTLNAQKNGAAGVIIADNTDSQVLIMMNASPEALHGAIVTIPAIFILKKSYLEIREKFNSNSTVNKTTILNAEGERATDIWGGWSKFLYIVPVIGLSICLTTIAYRQLKSRVAAFRVNNGVNRIPRVKFGEVDIHNDSCCVCLTDFELDEIISVLPCGHGYHQQCIDTWISDHSDLCPMCKRSILLEPIHEAGRSLTCCERNCSCLLGSNSADQDNLLIGVENPILRH